ncbi:MAG: LssY C-terminal domain-containing protein [Vicinamibacterales bacterium]
MKLLRDLPVVFPLVLLLAGAVPAAAQGVVPAGTEIQFRLRQLVSSFSSKPGLPVFAVVLKPVLVDERIAIPLGAVLQGEIGKVRRVGLGFARERAYVTLHFDRLILPGGETVPIAFRVTEVDDARETVDETGRINGIRATASFTSMIAGMATSASFIDPMLLGFTTATTLSVFRIPESEVIFPAGTELRGELTEPVSVSASFQPPVAPYAEDAATRAQLREMVRTLPFRTATEGTGIDSDVTNLLFIGSAGQVEAAFNAAGWGQTDQLNARSSYNALRAIVENQGYREAPMSTLLLDGRAPEMTYAKTLNTFFKRHHLRIFETSATFDGAPVLTSSSTHDSGIGFATRRKTFIHVIDEVIDEERDKVVHDMLLTGCVDGVTYVDRPWLPDDLSNSTGDTLRTDKRIAVLRMNGCEDPMRADQDVSADAGDDRAQRGNAVTRATRNMLLALKNDFWRGNIIYQGYSAVKLAVGALAGRGKETPPEGRAFEFAGEEFKVVPGAEAHAVEDAPKDVHEQPARFEPIAEPRTFDPRLVFSFSGGTTSFGGNGFSTLSGVFPVTVEGTQFDVPVALVTRLQPRGGFAARATLRSWSHVSQEFARDALDAPVGGLRDPVHRAHGSDRPWQAPPVQLQPADPPDAKRAPHPPVRRHRAGHAAVSARRGQQLGQRRPAVRSGDVGLLQSTWNSVAGRRSKAAASSRSRCSTAAA